MTTSGLSPRDQRRLERAEHDIDRAEIQLAQMQEVRRGALTRALPFLLLVLTAVFGSGGWGIGDLIPTSVAAILLGGTAAFGVFAHLGEDRS